MMGPMQALGPGQSAAPRRKRAAVGARALGLAIAAGLAGCGGGSSSSAPALTNLGLSAKAITGKGELWFLLVSEASEGGRDLNGDGDAQDDVPFVLDLADDSLTNLGLAGVPRTASPENASESAAALAFPFPFAVVGDVLIAFGASETDQGADLNGDGDTDDIVLQVYDSRTRTVTSTDLAAGPVEPAIGIGSVAFAVQEAAQDGTDLDNDGTTNGLVLHVFDSRTALSTNAARNVTGPIRFHDHVFAFTTDEPSAGADLNGDGDALDGRVLQLYDLVFGGVRTVALAIRGEALAVAPEDWVVLGDEIQTGGDLNGDGDAFDGAYQLVEPHGATFVPLDLSSADPLTSAAGGAEVALIVQEIDGLDRNADGDELDSLVVLVDTAHQQRFEPPLAVDPNGPLAFAGNFLAFGVDELGQGLDLNGDGDDFDRVAHVLERPTGIVTNLGIEIRSLEAAGTRVLLTRFENDTGDDFNGDGDAEDVVDFLWEPGAAFPTSTGLAIQGPAAGSTPEGILFAVVELDQGEDLNGDGDLLDLVYVWRDLATHANRTLGVPASPLDPGLVSPGVALTFLVESDLGQDLNGDGDTSDLVLHRLRVP